MEERSERERSGDRQEKPKPGRAKPRSIHILVLWSEAEEEDSFRSRVPTSPKSFSVAIPVAGNAEDEGILRILFFAGSADHLPATFPVTSGHSRPSRDHQREIHTFLSESKPCHNSFVYRRRWKTTGSLGRSKEQKVSSRPLEFRGTFLADQLNISHSAIFDW